MEISSVKENKADEGSRGAIICKEQSQGRTNKVVARGGRQWVAWSSGELLWAERIAGVKPCGGDQLGGFESQQGGQLVGLSEHSRQLRRWGQRGHIAGHMLTLGFGLVSEGKWLWFGAKRTDVSWCISAGCLLHWEGAKGPWAEAGRQVQGR